MRWVKMGHIFSTSADQPWMHSHAAVPFADQVKGTLYRVYFSTRDAEGRARTGTFDIDLARPTEVVSLRLTPLLDLGELGTFDESGAMGHCVLDQDGFKYLYYVGWNLGRSVPFRNAIGLAVSRDGGASFEKISRGPIMDRGRYDPCFVTCPEVLVKDGVWRMWYSSCVEWRVHDGIPRHYYHIKYAESEDGIEWEPTGVVCIDFRSPEEYAISRPCVRHEDGIFKMWYSYRGDRYRIGYAESADGLDWERRDEEVGIGPSEAGWDSEMIAYAGIFEHQGSRYMLYNGNGYGLSGVGLAKLDLTGAGVYQALLTSRYAG